MKASLKSKYDSGPNPSATATLILGAGDLKLKASCSDRSFVDGKVAKQGLSFGVEKPGSFMIDYDVQSEAARFQFMNSAKIAGKQLKLTYIHPQKRNATLLEGSLAFDAQNKITGKYSFATEKAQVKYSYVHGTDLTLEPGYDFGTESWNFSASQKFLQKHTLKAVYETKNKTLGLEWNNDDKESGQFKLSATVHLEDDTKPPKFLLERTWNCEL